MNINPLNRSYTRPLRANHSVSISSGQATDRSKLTSDSTSIDFSDAVIIRGKEVGKAKRVATKLLVGLGAATGMVGGLIAGFNPLGALVSAGALGYSALKNDTTLTVNGKTLNFSRPFPVKSGDSTVSATTKAIVNSLARLTVAGGAALAGFGASPLVGVVVGAGAGALVTAHGVARLMPN